MGFRSVITFIVLTFALHSCMDDDGGKIHQASDSCLSIRIVHI